VDWVTTGQSYYRPLFRLLAQIDREIAEFYAERNAELGSMRFVGPLLSLGERDTGMTVKDLALARDVTHSAMSQTVTAMNQAGLATVDPGADARHRVVTLTARGRALIPLIRAEWQATEATLREIDEEIGHPLMEAVRDVVAALERVPFPARLRAHLNEVDQ
jgi:DNA-binding MarR family transcriptional regulator